MIFYPGGNSRTRYYPTASLNSEISKEFRGYLDTVEIRLNKPCEYLPLADMLESCNWILICSWWCESFDSLFLFLSDYIKVDTPDMPLKAVIVSDSVWGILRGMETFSQLVIFIFDFNYNLV